jgi:hypothetical protein
VTLKADTAHNLKSLDPQRSGQLLLELRADLSAAIADWFGVSSGAQRSGTVGIAACGGPAGAVPAHGVGARPA